MQWNLQLPLGALVCALAACLPNPPGVRGVAGTAPAPNGFWTPPPPPPGAAPRPAPPPQTPPPPRADATPRPAPPPNLPPDLAGRIAQLRLADVIDIALRNNTATSASWADARAAAASYGAAQGQYYPTLQVDGVATAVRTVGSGGQTAVRQQFYRGTLSLSWLLLDFGGRSGAIGE